ncbi:MAG: hypothetical protein CO156_05040 [Candidatus Pacebacteria bacterium CG_4_9_14_3_um_filter_40_12]|nr:MAG: hypothetical protein COU64_03045 [Candidatus Pacebacteria bacterium CG10_big_fil_rev_8_21_14_0_10_40_26]PIZ79688.1 MAG: hypothetical protein COY01_00085 [Candidatus Pacebacteria bacterium CG_4_10_14_0_2_um_filter_40_20]PJA68332.1 MAG: hypothetical protein CO156_05040 [Candidatus Pacebacteria bacterium CG_4_9_14_3_um_filter_40_12]PJC41194.1 MAG: hypothetical protein CO041_05110 [Candidatus Pacebacteria bacterium CG_4_9_14_0_2_um_filter_40_15]
MHRMKKFFRNASSIDDVEPPKKKKQRSYKKLKVGVLLLLTIIFASLVTVWWYAEEPLESPISSLTSFSFLRSPTTSPKNKKVIYGFLPYWNVTKVTIQPELTHLSYFSLTIGADGSLITQTDEGTEPGFSKLNSDDFLTLSNQIIAQNGNVELVLTQFNADDISSFLNNPSAQEKFLTSLDSVLLAYPFTGVNIDVELNGSPSPKMRDQFTTFMQTLRTHLNERYGNITLSVDMYASAVEGTNIWDISALSNEVDYIVVMAYDFHRRQSSQAGPVAPLFGGKDVWDNDINTYLQGFVELVPPEKVLLGIPFYGYEWQTTSRDAQSHTFPDTGATASYERVQELLKRKEELKVEEGWNENALSPYISYVEDNEIFVVYYENSRSISYKLDYVNQLDLGGIAIWALGYEGNSRELWEVINKKVSNPLSTSNN